MKKFKLLNLFLVSALLISPCNFVSAAQVSFENEQITNDNTLEVRLDTIVVNTNYDQDQVTVVRLPEKNGVTKIDIKDNSTGKILETMSEYEIPATNVRNNFSNNVSNTTGGNYSNIIVNRDQYVGPITIRFSMQLNVYVSGSFRQINYVASKNYYVISSGTIKIEDGTKNTSVSSTTGKFPTTEVNFAASGVATGTLTLEKGQESGGSGGVNIGVDELLSFGFDVSKTTSTSVSTTYYVRGFVSNGGNYSLY